MAELLYKGSVKDIYQKVPATAIAFGDGYMFFRPLEGFPDEGAFSIFDYGEMPWGIKGKHEDLYNETLRFQKALEDAGIETHFTEDLGGRKVGIKLARMLGYDEIKSGESVIYRIPIECVFSKVISPPASAHGRLRKGEEKPEKYGADHVPERGEFLFLPKVATSYSTKIERGGDVYKGLKEMSRLAGLVGDEPEKLDRLTVKAADALVKDAGQAGLVLADGKFEFVLGPNRNFVVCDTGYTWDENRILYQLNDGRYVDLSKQFIRNVYGITGWKKEMNDWKNDIKKAKKDGIPESEWPQKPPPHEVGDEIKGLCANMCTAVRHELTREAGGPRIGIVAKRAIDALDSLKEQYRRDETGAPI